MQLRADHVARLERFMDRIKGETYPENPSALHTEITEKMMGRFFEMTKLQAGAKILDVGCGQGVALERFKARGCEPTGITLNSVDVAECQKKGFNVLEMEQSFLDFPDGSFDAIWCRHCLEHSIFPYFTLVEFQRVLKPGAWLYVEVPAPDTSCQHQTNMNHYSVLGKSMLGELMKRSGFRLVDVVDINFQVTMGPDVYWAFLGQRG